MGVLHWAPLGGVYHRGVGGVEARCLGAASWGTRVSGGLGGVEARCLVPRLGNAGGRGTSVGACCPEAASWGTRVRGGDVSRAGHVRWRLGEAAVWGACSRRKTAAVERRGAPRSGWPRLGEDEALGSVLPPDCGGGVS